MAASLFLSANLGFVAGVMAAAFGWSGILLVIVLIGLFYRCPRFLVILTFLVLAFFGASRFLIVDAAMDQAVPFLNQTVTVHGRIAEEIDPGGNNQKVTLQAFLINSQASDILLLVTLSKYPSYRYGDILELRGKLTAPENFSAFRYDRYLARYGIKAVLSWPKVTYLGYQGDWYSFLLSFKARVFYLVNTALPEPEAGLATALLLGYKKTLMSPEAEAFSCCGLSHIVAISGSHLSLLAALAGDFLLALGCSRRRSFRPVAVFIWFYTILTGFQASAVRSAVMISLVLWGRKNGRTGRGGRILAVAAAVMLVFNPLLLRDDLGFQLSFLAMIALLYFYPLGIKLWGQGKIREPLIMTLMAQLLTWPVIAANFGNISLIAPLANILAVWIFAGLLPGLLLAVVLGLLFPAGAVWWFAPDYLMLKYLNTLSVWLAAWPHACPSYTVPEGFVVIYYLILAILYTIGTAVAKRRHRLLTGD